MGIPPIELPGTLRVPRLDIDPPVHRGSLAFARGPRKNLNTGNKSVGRLPAMGSGGAATFPELLPSDPRA